MTPGVSTSRHASPGSAHGDRHESPRAEVRRMSDEENSLEAPSPKSAKTGSTYQCPYCPYKADKKVSLNRHLRMHSPTEDRLQAGSPNDEDFPIEEMRCNACKIQFTSFKTLLGHKEYYCAMRHRNSTPAKSGQATPQSTSSRGSGAQSGGSQESPVMHLNPAALMPSLLPPGVPPMMAMGQPGQPATMMLSTPVMTPSGVTNMAFNVPTVVMQSLLLPNMFQAHQTQPTNPASETPQMSPTKTGKEDQPLDLTIKRESVKRIHSPPVNRSSTPKLNSSDGKEEQPQDLSVKKSPKSSPAPSIEFPATATSPGCGSRRSTPGSQSEPSLQSSQSGLLPGLAQPMGLLPQGTVMMNAPIISKCHECNIVFYKHENYVIHKEHYCASRRVGKRPSKDISPPTTPNMENGPSPRSHSEDSSGSQSNPSSPRGKGHRTVPFGALLLNPAELMSMDQGFLQFYCIPCKIKFSSMDTLKAHQQFYCPSRSELPPAPLQTAAVSPVKCQAESQADISDMEDDDEEGGTCICPHCGNSYPSMRLLKLHFCKAASMQVPLLRCPYCDYITQSDNRLIEHIKAHAPTKAYKCTICGYRGNTVRGMRMHGKMHVDAGEEFTDENMLEFEEPPLIPKRLRTVVPDNMPIDIEAELIRLKNEPYKRRRSRKLYERHDSTPLLRRQAPHMCVTCNEVFPDTSRLRLHMRIHMEESLFTCRSCDFVSSNKASLVRHVKMVHEISLISTENSGQAENNENIDHSGIPATPPKPNVNDMTNNDTVKKEPLSEGYPDNEQDSVPSPEKYLNKTNGLIDMDKLHMTEVGKDENGDISVENTDKVVMNGSVEKDERDIKVSQGQVNVKVGQGQVNVEDSIDRIEKITNQIKIIDKIKYENRASNNVSTTLENNGYSEGRPVTPESPLITKSEIKGKPPPNVKQEVLSVEEIILARKNDKTSPQYCKQCDITFMYFASFMAHKKYYCSSHAGEKPAAQLNS